MKGKKDNLCSSDPTFFGNKTNHNPEGLFLASISACHMLWHLHLCAADGIINILSCNNNIQNFA
ncbi:MAG: hypothetical protein QXW79_02345 [Thermoplasmata archaeon]